MVRKIVGYDDAGKKIFEREAREYDKSLANMKFGITLGDIVKAVPIIFLCGIVWANQKSTNEKLANGIQENTVQIKEIATSNTRTLSFLQKYVSRVDNYLSATTGKRFKNGEPL